MQVEAKLNARWQGSVYVDCKQRVTEQRVQYVHGALEFE